MDDEAIRWCPRALGPVPMGDVGDVGDGEEPEATGFEFEFDGFEFEFLVLLDSGDSFWLDGEEFGRTLEEDGLGVGVG